MSRSKKFSRMPNGIKRDQILIAKVDEDEKTEAQAAATMLGVSISDFIRMAVADAARAISDAEGELRALWLSMSELAVRREQGSPAPHERGGCEEERAA